MEEIKVSSEKSLDLVKLARVVLRKWFIVALAGVLAAVMGFVYSNFFVTPLYSSSTTMLVDLRNSVHEDLSSEKINVAEKYVPTVAYIIRTNTVLEPVIEELGLKESVGSLASKISVQTMEDTLLIRVSVKHADPKAAISIVKAISKIAPEIINQRITSGYITEIESPTVSSKPVTPNVMKSTVLAGFVGALISAIVIIVLSLFDNKIKSIEELQEHVDLPLLGIIPALQKNNGKGAQSI